MRTCILYFTGSDIEQVNICTKAIQYIDENSKRDLGWIFVLPPFLLRKVDRNLNIQYVLSSEFVHSRWPDAIRVQHILGQLDKKLWFDSISNYLITRFGIKLKIIESTIGNDLSSISRTNKVSLCFESVFNPCDGYGSSAEGLALACAKQDSSFNWSVIQTVDDAYKHVSPSGLFLKRCSEKQNISSMNKYVFTTWWIWWSKSI